MKYFYALLLASVMAVSRGAPAAETVNLDSSVTDVTVYPEWAYVTRTGAMQLKKGDNRGVLKELPALIDEDSIRVKLIDANSAVIAGVSSRSVYLRQFTAEDVRIAEKSVTELEDKMGAIKDELAVLAKAQTYYDGLMPWKLAKIPHESAVRPVDIDELRATGDFITGQLLAIARRRAELTNTLRQFELDLNVRKREFEKLSSRAQLEQKEVAVEIVAEKAGEVMLSISYLISGASWYPSYDARATEDGREVELTCKAVVQQSTGEDWDQARFTLSTIQPYLVRQKPVLEPWFVQAEWDIAEPVAQQTGSFRNLKVSNAQMAAIQSKQYAFNNANPEAFEMLQDNIAQAREVVRQVEERGTTVELPIAGTYAVKTDGKPVLMTVGQTTLESRPRYTAVPAVSGSTYVTGQMRNSADFPFLPGPVNVYKAGSLVGKSSLDSVAEGEKMELFLGLEERIKVTRTADKNRSSSAMFGDKKKLNVGYVIEVSNFLETDAIVEISDQIPVSREETVKVRLVHANPKTDKPDKGIITWRLNLPARSKHKLSFEFQVEYPANAALGNAEELERQIDFAM